MKGQASLGPSFFSLSLSLGLSLGLSLRLTLRLSLSLRLIRYCLALLSPKLHTMTSHLAPPHEGQ
jgi:hypothetical protein